MTVMRSIPYRKRLKRLI